MVYVIMVQWRWNLGNFCYRILINFRFSQQKYSRTLLSRTRLFRITAYLEVKIWSLFKHETMTTGNKMMWKRGEIAPKEQFLLFFHIILYIFPTSGVKLYIHLFNVVVQFIVFLTFSTLICRGTDISKCFSESLGIRDNESRLYIANLQNSSIFHVQYVFTAVWCQALS